MKNFLLIQPWKIDRKYVKEVGVNFSAASPKKKFFVIFAKMTFIGVILCEKLIACIPEA